jgi:hypothetical protein
MGVDADLYTLLHGNATIEALVETRITPYLVRQKSARPYIYWEDVIRTPLQTLARETGKIIIQRQIVCVAETADGAETLSNAVRDCVEFYQSGDFDHIIVKNIMSMPNLEEVNELIERYAIIVEVEIMYKEAATGT